MNRIIKRLTKQADALPYNTGNPPLTNTNLEDNLNQNDSDQLDPQIVYEITQLLDRVKNSANSLKDIYYALFDQLNGLYQSFPSIYKQLQMTVKLPTNQDAMNIVSFSNSLNQSLDKFKDPIYLKSYISNSSETL